MGLDLRGMNIWAGLLTWEHQHLVANIWEIEVFAPMSKVSKKYGNSPNMKRPNLHLIGVPECHEENESKLENILQDIIQENFPNLVRQDNTQLQVIQRAPQRYSSSRATPRHITVRFTRIEMKYKILRAAREKGQVIHEGKPIRLTADLSAVACP